METTPNELLVRLENAIGKEHVRIGTRSNAINGMIPQIVIQPGRPEELANTLQIANEGGLRVIPCGGGTKLSWGTPPSDADILISTLRLDRIVEHAIDDLTVTVESGCRIAGLQHHLTQNRQRLALDVLWPERSTVGGVLATNDSGSLRLRFGTARNLVLGMTVALSDGTLARSGGRVVKNVAGYDLPKLMIGAFGTLGIITEVTFRLHPTPDAVRDICLNLQTPAALESALARIADSKLQPLSVQLRVSKGTPIQLDVRLEGIEESLDERAHQLMLLANGAQIMNPGSDLWDAREELWESEALAVICKVGVRPSFIASLVECTRHISDELQLDWRLVIQADGVGFLAFDGGDKQTLTKTILSLRATEAVAGGSLVVLRCPADVQPYVDIWGPIGDSLPLMTRIKDQFDPRRILNTGRFVGGI
jgi:glycolate oxidase FAD binding subunit